MVGIVKATVTIPADVAAASKTSVCDFTSGKDVADCVWSGDCAPSELWESSSNVMYRFGCWGFVNWPSHVALKGITPSVQ